MRSNWCTIRGETIKTHFCGFMGEPAGGVHLKPAPNVADSIQHVTTLTTRAYIPCIGSLAEGLYAGRLANPLHFMV